MIDYSSLPQNKTELLERIDDEWAALEQIIDSLDEAQMTVPDSGGWSIKDNLAHLSVWEEFMRLHYLQNLPAPAVLNIDAEIYQRGDENEQNDILQQRSQSRSLVDVLAELHQTHAQVRADLAQIPFADLLKQHYPDDPEARPVLWWVIGNTYEHYLEHRLTIERFIEQGEAK